MASLMALEIAEIPQRAADLLAAAVEVDAIADAVRRRAPRWAVFAGRGTSDHAATYGRWRHSDRWLPLPTLEVPEWLTPLCFVLPGQLLAEAVAGRRGLDPDRPAGLAKVTLTR